jgi:Rnl2 family RNA ligase
MMDEFSHFHSIENSYREECITRFRTLHPDYLDATRFVVQEKVDGANISFHFYPRQPWRVASRNGYLTAERKQSFFEVGSILGKHERMCAQIQDHVNQNGHTFILYGELFGANINKRIKYGEKRIIFFDIKLNGQYLPHQPFSKTCKKLGITPVVPLFAENLTFTEALAFDSNMNSALTAQPEICEGVVIKPQTMTKDATLYFCLKKVNASFRELTEPQAVVHSDRIEQLRQIYAACINENRVISLVSKCGPPRKQDLPRYESMLKGDAKKDFIKDHAAEWKLLTKVQRRAVFRVPCQQHLFTKYFDNATV